MESMKVMVVGLSKDFKDGILFPQSTKCEFYTTASENEDIPWRFLSSSGPSILFDMIIFYDINCLFGCNGDFHYRMLYKLLSFLKEDTSQIFVRVNEADKLRKYLIKAKFNSTTQQAITIKEESCKFMLFEQRENNSNLFDKSKSLSERIKAFLKDNHHDDDVKKTWVHQTFDDVVDNCECPTEFSFQLKEGGVQSRQRVGVSHKEFGNFIKNDKKFMKDFVDSYKSFWKRKLVFYGREYINTKNEYEQCLREFSDDSKCDNADSLDHHPESGKQRMIMVKFKKLYLAAEKRIETLSQEKIKKDLEKAAECLDEIVGREEIKDRLCEMVVSFSKSHASFSKSFTNFCFMGNPGIGKTTIAMFIAKFLSFVGIIDSYKFRVCTRGDLIGQYVGHTAPRIRKILYSCLEGVLFIDEVYSFVSSSANDYGNEAVAELVNFIDKFIGCEVVILSGYERQTRENFFGSNPGLERRFPLQFVLSDFSSRELAIITTKHLIDKTPFSVHSKVMNWICNFVSKFRLVFNQQGGDALNFSTCLAHAINSSYHPKWKAEIECFQDNIPILLQGVNDFLEPKGYHIEA